MSRTLIIMFDVQLSTFEVALLHANFMERKLTILLAILGRFLSIYPYKVTRETVKTWPQFCRQI